MTNKTSMAVRQIRWRSPIQDILNLLLYYSSSRRLRGDLRSTFADEDQERQ
jgi:hypothetical protein